MSLITDIEKIRLDFPILHRTVRDNKPLIYLDNAATTQKPKQVIDAISNYYLHSNANVHRGIHALSEEASELYEDSHQITADLINAKFQEIVFTKNTTEGINILTNAYREILKPGDEIVLSRMEHHSNIVPFQKLAERTGATIKFIELFDLQILDLNSAENVITDKTKLVSIPHMSNVLGTINPVKKIIELGHDHGAKVHLDGAQSVPHMKVDVKSIDVDYLTFSGHKMLGPMGIGALFGKEEHLNQLEPLVYGGDMIRTVSYEEATWNELPWKFEAGTPNVDGGIGLGAAVKYLMNLGMDKVRQIEHDLTDYAMKKLSEMDGVTLFGPKSADKRGGVISFNVSTSDGMLIHPHDVSTLLDEEGIAIRAGHHCAQPLMRKLSVPATCRISFYIYNTFDEIDRCIEVLETTVKMFS
jgi:cysteine desulfurase / selenocysteine lyase